MAKNPKNELMEQLSEMKRREETEREKERLKAEEEKSYNQKMEEIDNLLYEIQAETALLQKKEKQRRKDEGEIEPELPYPEELDNIALEVMYIALLYSTPNAISKYYFDKEICYFSNEILFNLYRGVIFKEGEKYAPPELKEDFSFPQTIPELYNLTYKMKNTPTYKAYDFEQIYRELKKLFILKRNFIIAATKSLQQKIFEIKSYDRYNDMTPEEVLEAIKQINVTNRLSQGVLNIDVAKFWLDEKNNLREGIPLPFPILTKVFKGLRKGETMSYAMPSNAGKSRFTINMACNMAFLSQKKVLIVSNEMSEDKMRLCLLTTILNHPDMQKLHGQKVRISEGELLEFKFRPDDPKSVQIDEDGYILKLEDEPQKEFVKRLEEYSSDFRKVIEATKWLDSQINNSIYFVHLTEYTNNDLHEVIINNYYKEGIEYIFYDTMKTDVNNIGNYEELKKTATLLSEIAQQFEVFIGSSLQLLESTTLPINLTINDLSVSKNIKEVLDTLCLIKQINSGSYEDYEYSKSDRFIECHDLEIPTDPDVRYYVCVVDKNRAGAKPRLLFRLNLAYNEWEELGYVRLKGRE